MNDLIKAKELEYRNYINNHIDNVNTAWDRMKNNPKCVLMLNCEGITVGMVSGIIANHDLSKYSNEEFDAYRKNYYPINDEEKKNNQANYKLAEYHHEYNNSHHWEYWRDRGFKEMPLLCIVEMLCDHIAMSIKFGGTAVEWFKEHESKFTFGDKNKEFYYKLGNAYYE